MKYFIEVRNRGWRQVRHTEAMEYDEANDLIVNLRRWNLGIFRIREVQ